MTQECSCWYLEPRPSDSKAHAAHVPCLASPPLGDSPGSPYRELSLILLFAEVQVKWSHLLLHALCSRSMPSMNSRCCHSTLTVHASALSLGPSDLSFTYFYDENVSSCFHSCAKKDRESSEGVCFPRGEGKIVGKGGRLDQL